MRVANFDEFGRFKLPVWAGSGRGEETVWKRFLTFLGSRRPGRIGMFFAELSDSSENLLETCQLWLRCTLSLERLCFTACESIELI